MVQKTRLTALDQKKQIASEILALMPFIKGSSEYKLNAAKKMVARLLKVRSTDLDKLKVGHQKNALRHADSVLTPNTSVPNVNNNTPQPSTRNFMVQELLKKGVAKNMAVQMTNEACGPMEVMKKTVATKSASAIKTKSEVPSFLYAISDTTEREKLLENVTPNVKSASTSINIPMKPGVFATLPKWEQNQVLESSTSNNLRSGKRSNNLAWLTALDLTKEHTTVASSD